MLALVLGAGVSPVQAATTTSSSAKTTTTPLEFSGWIPYWRTATGTADVIPHLSSLTEVNPFGYTVKTDGSLNDALPTTDPAWQKLFKAARAQKVRLIPTVMWSDTNSIDKVLRDPKLRAAHIQAIVSMIQSNNFDGVDIDYEGKLAETRPYFSQFLKELSAALAKNKTKKWLMCTIEAREPLSARYSGTPPANIEYANDLPSINKYCDRVRIMTYDQGTADIELNKAAQASHTLYAPIADPAWVTKVVNYMATDIDKSKMELGVATYGYIYQVMPTPDGKSYNYTLLEAFNPTYGTDTAKAYGITPTRSSAGELTFTYVPKETVSALPSQSALAKLAPRPRLRASWQP